MDSLHPGWDAATTNGVQNLGTPEYATSFFRRITTRPTMAQALLKVAAAMAATPLTRLPETSVGAARKIGLISFLVSADRSGIDELATQRFTDELLHAQPGLELIELGPIAKLLGKLGRRRLDEEAAAAIGRGHALDSIILGQLSCTHPYRPPSALGHSRQSTVAVALSVRVLDGSSGRVKWNRTLRREEPIRRTDAIFGTYRRPQDDAGDALIGELLHEICVELCPRRNGLSS